MSDRYRVEAVPGHDGSKGRRQWRVRDEQTNKVIHPGSDLSRANLYADKLNREHNEPEHSSWNLGGDRG